MALPKNSSEAKSSYVVDARVRIGHVHLKVLDIGRTLGFYCGVLGFEIWRERGFSFRGRLSPSFGGEYLGEPRRVAASSGDYRALSHRDCLSHAGETGGGAAQGD